MLAGLEQWILSMLQSIFEQFGWLGVAGMMVFENATGITPSEVILGLAGWFLIAAPGHSVPMVFIGGLYAALGSVTGASVAYWAARLGGRPLVDKLAGYLHIPLRHIDNASNLFQRWGPGLVLFGRLAPGIRTIISIPAGLSRMHFGQFFLSTFIGAYVWCSLLLGLGYWFGHEWQRVSGVVAQFAPYAAVLFALGAGVALYIYWRRRPVAEVVPVEDEE